MVRITKACLPWIRRNRGRIINVTDTRGRWTVPGCAAYAMTRYGVESFSDALRYEMQQWGVKVSVVEICKKFEGVCDVIDNKNLWDELDKKAQRHYGKSYYDDCIASWDEDLKGGDKHIGIIVRKTLDAVWSRIPRDRYVIGSLSDQVKTFMYTSLPSFITDGPIKESYSSKVTPTVLH
ncbi:D-beta-hydroxybutyrate dehydrogenase, mitochondrial-like [Glandiceps talaboti]